MYASLTLFILSYYPISLSTFILHGVVAVSLSSLYSVSTLIFILVYFPMLGLLDTSLGYPTEYNVSQSHHGVLFLLTSHL